MAEQAKARIITVGIAGYLDGRPMLSGWLMDGGPFAFNASATGPDDPVAGGWTFRELHAIANGVGPDVEPVLPPPIRVESVDGSVPTLAE